MKLLIASDLHGSAKYCRLLIETMKRENADKLLLLGDVLYHGPRNPLPEDYAPQQVLEMLTEIKNKVICVRGNCDAEIDVYLLPFPVPDYSEIFADGLKIYLSHGHREVPPLCAGDIYITGHTHVPLNVKENEGYYHLNPGSITQPKDNTPHSYILYNNRTFSFKTLDGELFDTLDLSQGAPVKRPPVLHRRVIRRR